MVVIVGVLGLGGYMFFVASEAVSRAQGRVYILANGKVLEALASDRKENIPVEARDHVRTFHGLFFTLDPDEKVIEGNLSRALYLADGSAKRIYENLKESGYYANVISANISQRLVIDSIRLDMTSYPFYFRCYGQETIIRTTSIVTRDLVTEGWLRDVSRSDNNAHGFLIERWSILENKDLKVEQR
jgi:conjugative transposon TraK protein